MFILTLCPVSDYDFYFDPGVGLSDFLSFFSAAAFLAIPIGIFVFCWRNFVTDAAPQRSEVRALSLDEPIVYAEEAGPSVFLVPLYLLTGMLTFCLGVLAFEVVHAFL